MQSPVEITVDEVEPLVARVAGIDVAKASGMVCTRMPHESVPGRRVTRVWQVKSTTAALGELAEHLAQQGIERVVVESTSDYWRPFFYLLEAAGLSVWLVNAAQVKNVPGRPKTDKLDGVWLAKLAERSMVAPSFVPAEPQRAVRDLARARFDLVEDRARVKQRVEKLLEDALIKISSVLTDVHGASGRAMIEALIAGQRNPKILAELARGRARARRAEPDSVRAVLGEIGLDMSVFGTAGRLCSWAKVSPRTVESGRTKGRATTGRGNRYLKAALGQMAVGAAKTDTFLSQRYRRLIKRMPKAKARAALQRSILVIIFHLLTDPTARFEDLGSDFYTRRLDHARRTDHLTRQLRALGWTVQLTPAA